MENSTKERLTGALILVAALVILVPEMLSGPREAARPVTPAQDPQAGAPMRTYDMPLDPAAGGQRPQGLAPTAAEEVASVPPPVIETAPPPVEPSAAPAPAPAAEQGATQAAATGAAQAVAPAVPAAAPEAPATAAKPPAARPADATASAGGKWWVQAGVFASSDNAQRLARELKAAGMPAVVSQITVQGKQMHRVRAGPVADRPAALALQAKLAAKGHKSSLVAP